MLSLYFQRKQTPNHLTFHLQRKKTLKPLKLQRKHMLKHLTYKQKFKTQNHFTYKEKTLNHLVYTETSLNH